MKMIAYVQFFLGHRGKSTGAMSQERRKLTILVKEIQLIGGMPEDDSEEPVEKFDEVDEEEDDAGRDEETLVENDDFEENWLDKSTDTFETDDNYDGDEIEFDILESVRCGAHTAQLAVWDVLREYKQRLSNINKKCLKMHLKKNRQLFLFHKIPLPPKTCETRWNVWYLLLRYLKELQNTPFLSILKNNDPDIVKCCF